MPLTGPDRSRRQIVAALLRGPGRPLSIEPVVIEAPRDDEVLVRIAACGICGTDVHLCEGGVAGAAILGHEGAGVVEEVGAGVSGLAPGDHVVLSYQSCGHCGACDAGCPADCAHFRELNFGFERLDGSSAYAAGGVRGHFFGQSAFASHAVATARNLVKVDRALPLDLLAPLGCGIQTGAGTVMNSLGVREGQGLAVLGVGPVGLAAVMAARVVGAAPVIAVDMRPGRLNLARELGATHAIDPRRSDIVRRIARITGGGIDHAVESTGDPGIGRAGCDSLNPGGRIALLAGGADADLGEGRSAISVVQGDAVPQRFIPRLIRLWRQGRFPFSRLVRFYPFAEINRALADARGGRVVKAVLRMDGAP